MTELEQILKNLSQDFGVRSIAYSLAGESVGVADEYIPYLVDGWDYIRSSHLNPYDWHKSDWTPFIPPKNVPLKDPISQFLEWQERQKNGGEEINREEVLEVAKRCSEANMEEIQRRRRWKDFAYNVRDIVGTISLLRGRKTMTGKDFEEVRACLECDPRRADCLLTAAWWCLSKGGIVKSYTGLMKELPLACVTEMMLRGACSGELQGPQEVPADECFAGCPDEMRRAFAKFPYYLSMGLEWNTLVEEGYVTEDYKLDRACCSRAEARRIVEGFYKIAHKKGAGNKRVDWEPFEAFWGISNLGRTRKLDEKCDKAKKIAQIFS